MSGRTVILLIALGLFSQELCSQTGQTSGLLTASVIDESSRPLEGATCELIAIPDSASRKSQFIGKDGQLRFESINPGYYRLRVSFVGFQTLTIDSIWFRAERMELNLHDLILHPRSSGQLSTVIVYSEKPVVESKDGNITFHATESPLSAGASANELLSNVPLVARDADGKITVKGKEPRILIDDKPVELNLQQLQDLLESMPGSSIEKIEVMTNPPPQYANEQGGVINIVTRKGKAGRTGRINWSGGTRGETGISGSYTYRKQGIAVAINGGIGYSRFSGFSHSSRQNFYTDSSNLLRTSSANSNDAWRPNLRINFDYDLSKFQSLNAVLQLNGAQTSSVSQTDYATISHLGDPYRVTDRNITTMGNSSNEALNLSYLLRTNRPGEQLRLIVNNQLSQADNNRRFYQRYFNPDFSFTGLDSTQTQHTTNESSGHLFRADYDRPLANKKTFFSFGSFYSRSNSAIQVDAAALKKPDNQPIALDLLSNDFRFHQTVVNFRGSFRQLFKEGSGLTAGASMEKTGIWFELLKEGKDARNEYWTLLPFASLNKNWNDKLNLTLSWRRSIRRPGLNELNPTIDFADPYNIYFGNEHLRASTADNFDIVVGRTRPKFYINLGGGYNSVRNIFSRVRSLLADGKTQVTWENISGRKELETSVWGGFTVVRKWRTNFSTNYTYNFYGEYDRAFNHYRNGGSFTSNINSSFTPTDRWTLTASFTFNRFASPQGYARWNWSMNTGLQRKLLNKRLSVTANLIDPFRQQQTRSYTYGERFIAQSFGTTRTRNYRLSISYNLTRPASKPKIPVLPPSTPKS